MKLSFVIPVMGRLHHVKQTLESVLKQPESEVVLVDWSCPEHTGDWAKAEFGQKYNNLKVIHVPNKPFFHLSASRNIGADHAVGEFLCFLDCDMILKENFLPTVLKCGLNTESLICFQEGGDGFWGMLIVSKIAFDDIGGYNEQMEGWGGEDYDIRIHLSRFLTTNSISSSVATHIYHGDNERTNFYKDKDKNKSLGQNVSVIGSNKSINLKTYYPDIVNQSKQNSSSFIPKISFCTTCKGRLWQLRNTYLRNIESNLSYENIEFILLNYQSPDDMDSWVKDNLKGHIDRGIVKYYQLKDDYPWHASKSRNMSHRLASGDILCNLDADNFIGIDFAWVLKEKVGKNRAIRRKGPPSVGGFIALDREDFFKLGGYDESFSPMGHLDNDFENRMRKAGMGITIFRQYHNPIGDDDVQKAEFCEGKTYSQCCSYNEKIMKFNEENDITTVNSNGFIEAHLVKNWTEDVYLSGIKEKDLTEEGGSV